MDEAAFAIRNQVLEVEEIEGGGRAECAFVDNRLGEVIQEKTIARGYQEVRDDQQ